MSNIIHNEIIVLHVYNLDLSVYSPVVKVYTVYTLNLQQKLFAVMFIIAKSNFITVLDIQLFITVFILFVCQTNLTYIEQFYWNGLHYIL